MPFVTVADARRGARRRLPRLVFDFIDGAAGARGAERLLQLLRTEIDLTLAQLGRPDIESIDRGVLA